MERVTVKQAADMLLSHDDILILCHHSPDGDTLGSGYGLYFGLKSLGKRARVLCPDEISGKFRFMLRGYRDEKFEPQFIVAVDIADKKLMGRLEGAYGDKVDLCIDHHVSNTGYAAALCLDDTAAAAAQVIFAVLEQMGVAPSSHIANCLYCGLATDTGCFRYANTTAQTFYTAAKLVEWGADNGTIGREVFDTRSRARIMAENRLMQSLEFYFDDRCALAVITLQDMADSRIEQSDLDGLTALPRQIEGVEVGITIKEKEVGVYKVSVRTSTYVDACALCRQLGGGGHIRASGCQLTGTLKQVKEHLLTLVKDFLKPL